MAQSNTPRAEDMQKQKEAYVEHMRTSAGHFAKAAEQLANKGMPHLESTYSKMKAEGKVDPAVAGRDTLRKEADGIRKEAAALKDDVGAKKLGDRLARLDSTLQATAAQVAKQSPSLVKEGTPQDALRTKLAPAIEQGRQAYAEGAKAQAQMRATPKTQYSGPHKDEHKAVAGAERTARALASSEKLDKATRDKYAAVADKLHKLNDGIKDKTTAKSAYKEAQNQMRGMSADVKKATDKTAETRAGYKQYAAVHKKSEHSVKVAKATTQLATAQVKSTKAQEVAKTASAAVAEAAKPLGAAKADVAEQQKKIEPLETALKASLDKLNTAEKNLATADSAVKAAQQKLEAIQAENKASLFGGLFGGARKEEEAAKALAKAQEAQKAAESTHSSVKAETKGALESVDKAKGELAAATEKLTSLEKVHADKQAEAARASAAAETANKARESAAAALTKLDGKPHKDPLPNAERLAAKAEAPVKDGAKPKEATKAEAPAKDGAQSKENSKSDTLAQASAQPKEATKSEAPAKDGAQSKENSKSDTLAQASAQPKEATKSEAPAKDGAQSKENSKSDTLAQASAQPKEATKSEAPAKEGVSPVSQIRETLTSVNPNARLNPEGVTPLMVAARMGDVPMVKSLLEKGADTSLKNAEGKTAKDVAGTPEVAKAIEAAMTKDRTGSGYKVREDVDTRPAQPTRTAGAMDEHKSPDSMFAQSQSRAVASPQATGTTPTPAPTLDTASRSASSAQASPQAESSAKQAERGAPEREMSR